MKVIIYPTNDSIAVMAPSGVLPVEEVAKKDVPIGVPYFIVDATELPDTPQETWVVDFSEPDGYGGNVLPAAPVEKVNSTEDIEREEINYGIN